MKTLRYLLITFAVMTVVSVSAQSMAQQPEYGFKSTSSVAGSGSTLPQAAQTGAWTTYDVNSSSGNNSAGIRKGLGGGGGTGGPEDRPEPYETPIGNAAWPLLALAAGYAVVCIRRKCEQVAARR